MRVNTPIARVNVAKPQTSEWAHTLTQTAADRVICLAATIAKVDTIELFFRWPPKGLRRQLEAAAGRRIKIEDCLDRNGRWRGVRAIVNRPSKNIVELMSRLVRNRKLGCCVSRVDIAIDFETESVRDAVYLADWLGQYVILKWRSPKSRKIRVGNTIYWSDVRTARNLALYPKAPDIVRLELRFMNAGAVKRAGLDKLERLECIDLKMLFAHNLKAEGLTESYIMSVVRKTYKHDMEHYRLSHSRRYHPVTDLYRSKIPIRVCSMLRRVDMQSSRAMKGKKKLDMAWLNIPNHVQWHWAVNS